VARAIAIFLLLVVTLDLSGLGTAAGDACGSDECPVGSSGRRRANMRPRGAEI